jgi:hypothetical protein
MILIQLLSPLCPHSSPTPRRSLSPRPSSSSSSSCSYTTYSRSPTTPHINRVLQPTHSPCFVILDRRGRRTTMSRIARRALQVRLALLYSNRSNDRRVWRCR